MIFKYYKVFHSLIFLLLYICFFHFVRCNSNDDELLKSFRPLKYSENCSILCENITCQPIKECDDGVILKNETYCGCCEACVKFLGEGDNCTGIIKGSLALGAQSRCKKGTICNDGKCQLNSTDKSCLLYRDIREKHSETGNYETEIWIPQCDEEGHYAAKQKKITKSVCFDKSGKKLFGTPDDSHDNTCACSRVIQDSIDEDPILFHVKPHEHCSSSGNFDTLQCIGNLCYCADEKTGDIKSELVKIDYVQYLDCFDAKIHPEDYLRDCEKELQRTKKLAHDFWKKGVKIHRIDKVKCDLDGTFSPTQCRPERCVCTDKNGQGIADYQADLNHIRDITMTCNCARDANSAYFQSFSCEKYGNYLPYTCIEAKCFCVDEDGDSIILKEMKHSKEDPSVTCKQLIKNLMEYPHLPTTLSTDDDASVTDTSFPDSYKEY